LLPQAALAVKAGYHKQLLIEDPHWEDFWIIVMKMHGDFPEV